MLNTSICSIDMTLSVVTTTGQSGAGSDSNKRSLFPKALSPSDCFMSYLGHSLVGEFNTYLGMHSVYSTALANWILNDLSNTGQISAVILNIRLTTTHSLLRMLLAILNKSRRQHPKMQQLYGRLPPITKTIQV